MTALRVKTRRRIALLAAAASALAVAGCREDGTAQRIAVTGTVRRYLRVAGITGRY